MIKSTGLLAAVMISLAQVVAAESSPLYLDPAQPQEVRIHDLTVRKTIEEKADMMRNSTPGVPGLAIPECDERGNQKVYVVPVGEWTLAVRASSADIRQITAVKF
jgi:hypothetical protein